MNAMRMMLAVMAMLVAGCSTPADEYYLLSAAGPAPTGGGMGVGVGPVTVAEYLDRSNIVFQSGPQKLEISDRHHWAGDMRKSVASVVMGLP